MKDPAFLFYSNDFDSGTKFFTDEQVGKYVRLMIAQHQHGHLSEQQMLFICKSYDKDVYEKFAKDAEGKYFNERLDAEIDKRKTYAQSRRDNRLKNKNITKTYDTTYDNHMGEHMENENENENKDLIEFKKSLLELSISENLVNAFCDIRQAKKQRFDHAAFFTLKFQMEKSQRPFNECIEISVNHGWADFNCEWLKNLKDLKPIQEKQYQWRHLTDISGGKNIYRGNKAKYDRDVLSYGETIILVSDGN